MITDRKYQESQCRETATELETHSESVHCMARSFDGEPRKLFIIGATEETKANICTKLVAVSSPNGAQYGVLWMPQAAVFKWDESLFKTLTAAYKNGIKKDVEELWKHVEIVEI